MDKKFLNSTPRDRVDIETDSSTPKNFLKAIFYNKKINVPSKTREEELGKQEIMKIDRNKELDNDLGLIKKSKEALNQTEKTGTAEPENFSMYLEIRSMFTKTFFSLRQGIVYGSFRRR